VLTRQPPNVPTIARAGYRDLLFAAQPSPKEEDRTKAGSLAVTRETHLQQETPIPPAIGSDGSSISIGSQEAQTSFMKNPSGNLAKAEAFYKSEHKG